MDLDISGGWGYDMHQPIVLREQTLPHKQLQHTLASMRVQLEMSMTQPTTHRYGGINLSETGRESLKKHHILYEKVTYHVTAMKESDYSYFIDAYKKGYGTETFDIEAHFDARKKATLHRDIIVWFYIKG